MRGKRTSNWYMMTEWGRQGLAAVVVSLLFVGVVVAVPAVLTVEPSTSLDDPDQPNYLSWNGTDTYSTTLTNDANHKYLLKIDLVMYDGKYGEDAVTAASANGANPINDVTVTHSDRGVAEDITHDLLSDGTAYFYNMSDGDSTLNVTIDAGAMGNVSLTRAPVTAEHISIRTHRQIGTENCGECHDNSSSPAVHQGMNATSGTFDDWQDGTCAPCHGQTMTDLHTDCDNACHYKGYPIVAVEPHGPSTFRDGSQTVTGEYYCGSGCHDGQQSATSAHMVQMDTGQEAEYCTKCHGQVENSGYVTEFHKQDGFKIQDPKVRDGGECAICHGYDGGRAHDGIDKKKRRCGMTGYCHG